MNCRLASLAPTLLLFGVGSLIVQVRAEEVDLLIVSGQSNAVGFDAKPEDLPPSDLDKKILFWWRCGDPPPDRHDSHCAGAWKTLRAQPLGAPNKQRGLARQYGNFAQANGGFGPEFGLARTLQASSERRIAVLKVAFSGTGIDRDWRTNDPGPQGSCFRSLRAELQLARAAAAQQGITLEPRGFFWIQGESDANPRDAPQYAERMRKLVQAVRKELNAPRLPCCLAVNTRFQEGRNKFMPVIVEQQKLAASEDKHALYIDTSKAPIANAAHFNSKGTLQVGEWLAAGLLRLENGSRGK